MPKLSPSVRVALIAALLVLLGFGAAVFSQRPPSVTPSPTPETAQATSTAVASETSASKKPLAFVFADGADVETVPDERLTSYTFHLGSQTIGVLVLTAGGDGVGTPQSFSKWLDGLQGKVFMGDRSFPITRGTVAGRDAASFAAEESGERIANILTEVDGRVLWLQSRSSSTVLEEFLEKLKKIEATT